MAETLFTAADMANGIQLEEAADVIVQAIDSIRADIKINNLTELESIIKEYSLKEELTEAEIINAYKKVQEFSIYLRTFFKNFPQVKQYEKISYAFYSSNGYRYTSEAPSGLYVSNGVLYYNRQQTISEIQNSLRGQKNYKRVQKALSNHMKNYKRMLVGTYRGKRFNFGHIAEAFEDHLSSHHSSLYSLLNINFQSDSVFETMADISFESYLQELESSGRWDSHETVKQGWQHLRNSLGIQRGTVAGDVGAFQIKARNNKLANVSTIMSGLKLYSKIFDTSISSDTLCYDILRYLSEPYSRFNGDAADFANTVLSKEIEELLNKADENIRSNLRGVYIKI